MSNSFEASDRTTRAVRAIALFLFILFTTNAIALAGAFLAVAFPEARSFSESYGGPARGWLWFAGIIGVGGMIWALVTGFRELEKSNAKDWMLSDDQRAAWVTAGSPPLDSWSLAHDFHWWLKKQGNLSPRKVDEADETS